jgi:RNAse (barnase) inhibitor barstar
MNASLFNDHARAGLYYLPTAHRNDLADLIAKTHLTLLQANVSDVQDSHQILSELGKAFNFPTWYGVNFDALHDCLADPDWLPAKRIILEISGLETFRIANPDAFSTLITVLGSAAKTRSTGKYPLWILLTSPAPGLANLPDA